MRTVLGESESADGPAVAREVGHILALLDVPDLHERVLGAHAEDEAIRVELRARQARLRARAARRLRAAAQELPVAHVEQRPELRARQSVTHASIATHKSFDNTSFINTSQLLTVIQC